MSVFFSAKRTGFFFKPSAHGPSEGWATVLVSADLGIATGTVLLRREESLSSLPSRSTIHSNRSQADKAMLAE